MEKPRLSFWEIWNMSFGFFGIQFGFALQIGNTSRIFQIFGAEVQDLALYTLAGPITGLLVQPVIGYLSDRTWHPRWGRRRPYFMIGAILASIALIFMPNAPLLKIGPALYIAIGMLWIMDTAFNISMEPFRAFVGDKLPSSQRTQGFAMQSFFIGIGSVIAFLLPSIFTSLGLSNTAPEGEISPSLTWAYYTVGIVFFLAVLYTVLTADEYPPEDMEAFEREKAEGAGIVNIFTSIIKGIAQMPGTMVQLAVVQFFTWFALYGMWVFTTPTIAEHVFGNADPNSQEYADGGDWVGWIFAAYSAVAAGAAFLLPIVASRIGRARTHMISLLFGGFGIISIMFIGDKYLLFIPMIGVGIAWASILSMPYAILAGSLPAKRMGYFMGVFNFFIVIPQIVAGVTYGPLISIFDNDPIYALIIGGSVMMIGGLFCLRIVDEDDEVK